MRYVNVLIILTVYFSETAFAQKAIDTSMAVEIGGIRQWINISAKDTSKPVLLFLSGGPGDSYIHSRDYFTKKLQEQFVVIMWDQRESGKTFQLNASPEPLTVARYQEDTHELITYLLHHFNRPNRSHTHMYPFAPSLLAYNPHK